MPIRPALELDEALAAFATTRSSELAKAIETLGREALATFTPPKKLRTNYEFHDKWLELVADPAKRSWCLDAILEKLPNPHGNRYEWLLHRLEALIALPPDPRIGHAMLALHELHSPAASYYATREGLARTLIAHADDSIASSPVIADMKRDAEVAAIFARTPLPKPAPLDEAVKSRAKKVKPSAKRDVSALYAAVYAAPDADEPREVLADALQELNDPRGEFIALQLREHRGDASDELRARAQELVQTHGKQWLGALRPITYRAELHRGFLYRLELAGSWSSTNWKEQAADPMLATLEELAAGQGTAAVYAQFIAGPIAKTIRSLEVFDDSIWNVIAATEMPRLRELHVTEWKRKPVAERFASLIAPWLATHPQITRLGCEHAAWVKLPKSVQSRITDLSLNNDLATCAAAWMKFKHLQTIEMARGHEPIVLGRDVARVIADRTGGTLPKLENLPKSIKRVEVVNNAKKAKELAAQYKKLEIVAVRPPSGTITGVK